MYNINLHVKDRALFKVSAFEIAALISIISISTSVYSSDLTFCNRDVA